MATVVANVMTVDLAIVDAGAPVSEAARQMHASDAAYRRTPRPTTPQPSSTGPAATTGPHNEPHPKTGTPTAQNITLGHKPVDQNPAGLASRFI